MSQKPAQDISGVHKVTRTATENGLKRTDDFAREAIAKRDLHNRPGERRLRDQGVSAPKANSQDKLPRASNRFTTHDESKSLQEKANDFADRMACYQQPPDHAEGLTNRLMTGKSIDGTPLDRNDFRQKSPTWHKDEADAAVEADSGRGRSEGLDEAIAGMHRPNMVDEDVVEGERELDQKSAEDDDTGHDYYTPSNWLGHIVVDGHKVKIKTTKPNGKYGSDTLIDGEGGQWDGSRFQLQSSKAIPKGKKTRQQIEEDARKQREEFERNRGKIREANERGNSAFVDSLAEMDRDRDPESR